MCGVEGIILRQNKNMKKQNEVKIGDRIRVTDGSLNKEVVYTVQGTRKRCPIVYDFWTPVIVKNYVQVP